MQKEQSTYRYKASQIQLINGLILRNGLGTVVGAWFGAFPIPLDWDRPWQAWPITCVVGAVAGNALAGLGSLLTIRQLYSR